MRKNVFDDAARSSLAQRAGKLKPSAKPLWGEMTVEEMLHHCTASMRLIMHAEPSPAKTTIKQHFSRFLFLHVVSNFPKNATTPKQLNVKQTRPNIKSLEEEKQALTEMLNLFMMQQHIYAVHPYFGKMTRTDWGILTWKHFDHHLRQFGV